MMSDCSVYTVPVLNGNSWYHESVLEVCMVLHCVACRNEMSQVEDYEE